MSSDGMKIGPKELVIAGSASLGFFAVNFNPGDILDVSLVPVAEADSKQRETGQEATEAQRAEVRQTLLRMVYEAIRDKGIELDKKLKERRNDLDAGDKELLQMRKGLEEITIKAPMLRPGERTPETSKFTYEWDAEFTPAEGFRDPLLRKLATVDMTSFAGWHNPPGEPVGIYRFYKLRIKDKNGVQLFQPISFALKGALPGSTYRRKQDER